MLIFFLSIPTYLSNNMVSTTQALTQMKSQRFIFHKQNHFMTTDPLTYVTNGIQ